ncbi:MAG: bifunctional riboflavin kinase/FAD synthetase [Chlamydiales bacterium]|nr:bifunctional riboflavin kinase/FAD synthetase [Chlamydiales bacterium]
MKTIYSLEDFTPSDKEISLTIGNFDGVHLGHQTVLSTLTGQKVIFSFSNHPVEILKNSPSDRLTTTTHRLRLFENFGVDTTILVPFTEAFSKQSAEEFLLRLRARVPFSHLVLGDDAVIGHGREGDKEYLQELAKKMDYRLTYLEPVSLAGDRVSSSRLRNLIHKGDFKKAGALLGRPYSIRTAVEPGDQQGRLIGFRTANLQVHSLCLPPLGVYVVKADIRGKRHLGVANLGQAPTLHAYRPPLLEVHFLDFEEDLYGQELEVFFLKFLRHERRFESIEALKAQIRNDIQSALAYDEKAAH